MLKEKLGFMNIAPISSVSFNRINFKKQNDTQNNTTSNTFDLPRYNVAFGALIKQFDRNPSVTLEKEIKQSVTKDVEEMFKQKPTKENFEKSLSALFEKYKKTPPVMKDILSQGIMEEDEKARNEFVKAYFSTINSHFDSDKRKKRIYFNMALDCKDAKGKSIPHKFLNTGYKYNDCVLTSIFESLNDYPNLQIKILKDKNDRGETIGDRLAFMHTSNEDKEAINAVLYKLCARTRSINRNDCLELLRNNVSILDEDNKQVVAALSSDECYCAGELTKEEMRKSFESLDNKAFDKLNKDSRNITVRGAIPIDNRFASYTPIEMSYMCLIGSEVYSDSDVSDVVKLCHFYNRYCENRDLVDFYTLADAKGRYVASSLVKSKEGIKNMNKTLKKNNEVLLDIYTHKDKDGKTLADYAKENDATPESIEAINEQLVEFCSAKNHLSMRKLMKIINEYSDILNPNMKNIKRHIQERYIRTSHKAKDAFDKKEVVA